MPVKQTGNWGGGEAASPLAIDYVDLFPATNGSPNMFMAGGVQSNSDNTNIAFWNLQSPSLVSPGMEWRNNQATPDKQSGWARMFNVGDPAVNAGVGTNVPFHQMTMARPTTSQKSLPSVRIRIDIRLRLDFPAGVGPNGVRIGVGPIDNISTNQRQGFYFRISDAGIYTAVEVVQADNPPVVSSLPGAVVATDTHDVHFEFVSGDVNSLSFSVNGTKLFETASGQALLPWIQSSPSGFIKSTVVALSRAAFATATPSRWVVFGTRMRYDYV